MQIDYIFKKKILNYILWVLIWTVFLFMWLVFLSSSRNLSTYEHWRLTVKAIQDLKNHPWWYWLGTFGPSSFYLKWDYKRAKEFVPENTYLQIALNNWVLSFILWLGFWFSLIFWIFKNTQNNFLANVRWYLVIWLFGLAVEGMFLHIFDDSMVVYLYLVLLGYFIYVK